VARDVTALVNIETSLTGSVGPSSSVHPPTTTLTFESERPAAVSTSHHRRQSTDSSAALTAGKPTEFPDETFDFPAATNHAENMPAAALVI